MDTVPTQHQLTSEVRPYWQTRPCPTWCMGMHADSDHPEDRVHYGPGQPAGVPLTLHDPVAAGMGEWLSHRAPRVEVEFEQHVTAVDPTVKLCIDGATALLRMTVDEADQLRAELAAVVSLLTGGTH
jgi:hypothetical protein